MVKPMIEKCFCSFSSGIDIFLAGFQKHLQEIWNTGIFQGRKNNQKLTSVTQGQG